MERFPPKPFPCIVCGLPCPRGTSGRPRITHDDECLSAYRAAVARDGDMDRRALGKPNALDEYKRTRFHPWATTGWRAWRQHRSAEARATMASLTPEERKARTLALRAGRAAMPAEARREVARQANETLGEAGRRERARKATLAKDRAAIGAKVSLARRPDQTKCAKGLHPWIGGSRCMECFRVWRAAR